MTRKYTRAEMRAFARDRLENPAPMVVGEAIAPRQLPDSLATTGKLIAPPGKFRAIGVDTFEGPTADYMIGDFDSRDEAIAAAKERAGVMNPCYVYDDQGTLIANFGKP